MTRRGIGFHAAVMLLYLVLFVAAAHYAIKYDGADYTHSAAFFLGMAVVPLVGLAEWIVGRVWK